MPSVERPQNAKSRNVPLVARLYSLNNNLIKEVKQPQTSILFPVSKDSKQELTLNQKSIYVNQMLFGCTTLINESNQKQIPIQEEENEEEVIEDNSKDLKNPKRFENSQKKRKSQEAFDREMMNNQKDENEKDLKKRKNQLKPMSDQSALISDKPFTQIDEKEMLKTKMVMNKLRENYLTLTKHYRPQEKESVQEIDSVENQKGEIKQEPQKIIEQYETTPVQKNEKDGLDYYLNLIIKKSPLIDEFVYLVRNSESDNPYDLLVRTYFQICGVRKKSKKNLSSKNSKDKFASKESDYFTLSINGICHFKEGKPAEFIPLKEWLKERETYEKIRDLHFFANFRKWKTVKMWRKSHKSFKRNVAKKALEERLFVNYPELKDAILKTKDLLYSMGQLKFMDFNFLKETQQDVIEIDQFIIFQEQKTLQTKNMIQNYSKSCHEIVGKAVESRLEILRNEVSHTQEIETFKKGTNQMIRIADNPYESLSFPENMSYDKRSILRKECHLFVRFFYLLDFLVVDVLTGVYLNSVRLFIAEIEDLAMQKDPLIVRDLEKNKPLGIRDPMLKLEISSKLDYSEKERGFEIVDKLVGDFKYQKTDEEEEKPEDFKNYNLITYPFSIDYDVIDDFNEQQKKYLEYGESRQFIQKNVVNIHQAMLTISPNLTTISERINNSFTEGITSLQAFHSFAKHPSAKKYKAILEEWEEREDEREAGREGAILCPEEWIDADQKLALEKQVKDLIQSEFAKGVAYLEEFRYFLQTDWEMEKLQLDLLFSKSLAKPAQTLNAVFNFLEYAKVNFQTQIPYQADTGLFRLNSRNLKSLLEEKPMKLSEKLGSELPDEFHRRYEECKKWLEESLKNLKSSTSDVENFILQTNNLKSIERKFAYYRDQIKTAKDVVDALKKFQTEVKKESNTFSECRNLEQFLTAQLSQVNDNLSKNQEIFSRDIKENAIPELEKECLQLEEKLCNQRYLDQASINVLQELKEFEETVASFRTRASKLNQFEDVLGLTKTKFETIKAITDDLSTKTLLWQSHEEWFKVVDVWKKSTFQAIAVEELQTVVDRFQKNVSKCKKTIPLTNELLGNLDRNIKDFSSLLPIVLALRNPKLTKSHFGEIESIIDAPLDFEHLLLEDLVCENVLQHQKKIIGISVQVTQEANLRVILSEIEAKYNELEFPLKPFKEDSPKDATFILGDCEKLLADIDKLIMMVNNVYGSRYLKECKKQAADKRKDILVLQDCLTEWIKFQKNYIYLESIFSQPEIKKPLQVEVKEFEDNVNKVYKLNVKKIIGQMLISMLNKHRLIEAYAQTFRRHNEILHELNKKINNFLDSKREAFPRFYFVSNDELVDILANFDSPTAVQLFVGKLFENVNRVDFGPDSRSQAIQGLISREGEQLPLKSTVNVKSDSADKWLKKLEDLMVESLHKALREGLTSYAELPRREWYLRNPAQVVSVITQLAWTLNLEEFLKNSEKEDEEAADLSETSAETMKNLEILTELVRAELLPHQQRGIVALITTEVHNRDINDAMIVRNIRSRKDFFWQQQLRFYFDEKEEWRNSLFILQINAKERYGYEYYGPASRIVITPLTDRCWITITSALHMKLGAAPAGPAGTGKTESTKDLAKSLGRLCIVFNCSDQIDFMMMEKLFRGVIKQGAWTCLDEFNRIDIEVLSVISQQLLEMRLALLTHKNDEEFFFCGAKCRLNDTCGVFITMNPGYAGRTELPDNLKSLFRPISMMIPDYSLIAQILLFSEGFIESKVLANKMIKLYKLASEQLSQQIHYDFGMRAIKGVLELAGKLKRQDPLESESNLLIIALRNSNLPKFLKEDQPLFNALISDLFPNIAIPESDNTILINKASEIMIERNLQPSNNFIEKMCQLRETMNVRFGTMITGGAFTGKSTVLQILRLSLNSLSENEIDNKIKKYQKAELTTINPKSVTMGELYGEENPLTKDWADGLASHYIRKGAANDEPIQKLVCFDGPVDALWIENMNSVLDDSRMLCLANGQRIRLGSDMRILFEMDNLEQASPATISRCGMVYVSDQVLGWQSLVKSWLQIFSSKKTADGKDLFSSETIVVIEGLFNSNMESFVEYFKTLTKPLEMVVSQCVKTSCTLMEIYMSEDYGLKSDQPEEYKVRYAVLSFVLAVAWGFEGPLFEKEAERLDNLIKKKFPTINFPSDLITNCFLEKEHVTLKLYSEILEKPILEEGISFWEIIVPTVETTKASHIVEWLIKFQKNVFFTGLTGVGKSILATSLLRKMTLNMGIDTFKYNFSAQTNSKILQESLMSNLFLLSQKSRGARFGRKNVIYIDDVNMPLKEQYGAQPPLELLRQYLDFGYVFDRKEMYPILIQDTSLLCLAAPPEGGRQKLSPRFIRHFSLFCLPVPKGVTVSLIFITIFEQSLINFDENIKSFGHDIVIASIELFEKICREKLPTPAKFHYTFNLRDLSKIFMGLTKISKNTAKDQKSLARLWGHEVSRVFYDRFSSEEDRTWFVETVNSIVENQIRIKHEEISLGKTIYSDIFSLDDEEQQYDEIIDRKKLIQLLEAHLDDYNDRNSNKMRLVFFEQPVENLMKILRILRQARGNCMLIGLSGLGKTSLVRLTNHIAKYQFAVLDSSQAGSNEKFKEWLRKQVLLKAAGPDAGKNGSPFTLLVSEVKDDNLLEDVNNLLSSGEVQNIFPKDEKEKLEKGLIDLMSESGKPFEPADVGKIFIERVRENLHIVLNNSPVGGSLRISCRKFPALVDCCTIICFENWPGTAIQSVATKFLESHEFVKGDIKEDLSNILRKFHESSIVTAEKFTIETKRPFYITPKTALDNIEQFTSFLSSKGKEIELKRQMLEKGSIKLDEMAIIVQKLKTDLTEAQPKLEAQRSLAEKKLIELESSSKIANEKKELVETEAASIQLKTEQIEFITNQAKSQLLEALPRIQKVENDVRNIDKKELNIVRSLKSITVNYEHVFKTVALILEESYGDWPSFCSKMFVKSDLMGLMIAKLEKIKEVNSIGLTANVMTILAKNLRNEIFQDAKIEKEHFLRPVAMWCRGIFEFSGLKKLIEPLEKNVREMNEKLLKSKEEYDVIAKELALCKDAFQKLQEEFNEMERTKRQLEEVITQTEVKLGRAEKLTHLLSDEGARWKESLVTLAVKESNIIGDILISSSIVSYMGPLTANYRQELLNEWQTQMENVKFSDNFSFLDTMGDPLVLRDWNINGLPKDDVSLSSALSAHIGKKWPLMIDPQLQAVKWIKNIMKQENNEVIILKPSMPSKTILDKLKFAVGNGSTVILEEVQENIGGAFEPVVSKLQYLNPLDQRVLVNIGEEIVDYNDDFKLFMVSKLSNPNFLPETFIKTNVINFTVTPKGLEEQLLAEVVRLERPDVESAKNDSLEKLGSYKKIMIDIEKKILNLLAELQNSPVEDENLVKTLEISKSTAKEISEKAAKMEELAITLTIERENYRSVAIRGSLIYFVVTEIAEVDPMYQNSLQYITKLIKATANQTSDRTETRKESLCQAITQSIFKNVSRCLFEAHKLVFSFLITCKLDLQQGVLSQEMWNLFLKGAGISKNKDYPNPDTKLFSTQSWELAIKLKDINEFWGQTFQSFLNDLAKWRKISQILETTKEKCEDLDKYTGFDLLLLLKIIKPEKLLNGITQYIKERMGEFYITPVAIDIKELHYDSDCRTPIIFVLSQGADPSTLIKDFGLEKGFKIYEKLLPISLGQGQGPRAESLIQRGVTEGLWILLENCHLAKTWMPSLERIIEDLQTANGIHEDFRLFLTSMPASYFPVSILQNGIKITTEPPRGIRANIMRSLAAMKEDFLDICPLKNGITKLTMGLCFFHAIIQERKKYGPLGWNIKYEFNDSDMEAAKDVLQMFLNEVNRKEDIPWDSIIFLTGPITYGGRVTDDLDRKLLMTTLNKFYCENVLEDRYKFCTLEDYKFPKFQDLQSMRLFAQQLNTIDDPELFGLHKNANLSYQHQETEKILNTILSVHPKQSSGQGESSAQKVGEMITLFIDPEKGVPKLINSEIGHKEIFKPEPNGLLSSLSLVLLQEIARFNKLMDRIKTSLISLDQAIQGKRVMSAELDGLFNQILINQVPSMWAEIAYPSLKPIGSWFKDLRERIEFMQNWLSYGNPTHYWLPGFFFPQGFLTGVMQSHARKTGLPIDKFVFSFKVTDYEKGSNGIISPEEGVLVSGLFLEGALWDKKRKMISDQTTNEVFCSIPFIHFLPKESNDSKGNNYLCPLYKTLARAGSLMTTGQSNNFILEVNLLCDKTPDLWTLRGVALFCMLND